jgi:hypothetical protein
MAKGRRRRPPDAGPWEQLRELHRKLKAAQNHPIYAARGNEQPLLQQLLTQDPPVGGLTAYLDDLDRTN